MFYILKKVIFFLSIVLLAMSNVIEIVIIIAFY